jgi:hypothetical protein
VICHVQAAGVVGHTFRHSLTHTSSLLHLSSLAPCFLFVSDLFLYRHITRVLDTIASLSIRKPCPYKRNPFQVDASIASCKN